VDKIGVARHAKPYKAFQRQQKLLLIVVLNNNKSINTANNLWFQQQLTFIRTRGPDSKTVIEKISNTSWNLFKESQRYVFLVCPIWLPVFFIHVTSKPGLGTGIDPDMAIFKPFPSSVGWDSNPQPFDHESNSLTTKPGFRPIVCFRVYCFLSFCLCFDSEDSYTHFIYAFWREKTFVVFHLNQWLPNGIKMQKTHVATQLNLFTLFHSQQQWKWQQKQIEPFLSFTFFSNEDEENLFRN